MSNRQEKRPLSFWMLADNTLKESSDFSQLGMRRMKARLIHALLFNVFDQKLVVSDSQLVHNHCLRLLLRSDDTVKGIFRDQLVAIAVRTDKHGGPTDLLQLIDDYKRRNKYLFDYQRLGDGDEIEYARDVCQVIPFKLDLVADRYKRLTLWMFGGTPGRKHLPEKLAHKIFELAQKQVSEHKRLEWIFFYKHLQQHLEEDEWNRHRETINRLAETAYHTGLPAILDADPIYAARHAASFELARGVRQQHVLEKVEQTFQGKLGLAALEQGLALLKPDDIIGILDSDESKAFAAARDAFDGSDASRVELIDSTQMYVWYIEHHILDRFEELRRSSSDGSDRKIELSIDQWKQVSLDALDLSMSSVDVSLSMAEVASDAVNLISLSIDTLGLTRTVTDVLILDRMREKEKQRIKLKERRNAAQQNAAKDEFLQQHQDSQKIEHSLLIEVPTQDVGQVDTSKADLDTIETCYR